VAKSPAPVEQQVVIDPWRRAISATDAPASKVSAARRRFSASLHRRRGAVGSLRDGKVIRNVIRF